MKLSVVVLAAGKGSRMQSSKPKLLHELAGKPILQHVLDTAFAIADEVIVVYGHQGEQLREQFSAYPVRWVLQAEQLGTADAVKSALPSISNEQVLILNGDVPLLNTKILHELIGNSEVIGLLTAKVTDPAGLGRIIRNKHNFIYGIIEEKDANAFEKQINEINVGCYLLPTNMLKTLLPTISSHNAQNEYYLPDIINLAVKQNISVRAILVNDSWRVAGINTRAQLVQLERKLQSKKANKLLENGVTVIDPLRIDIRGDLTVEQDVTIDINCIFLGKVTIGKGCSIGPNVIIKDSAIGDNTAVLANSFIDNAEVASNCNIGPFARIRPNTFLAESTSIGNFVEVKNSSIGHGTKINHLSYIGDAKVGNKVNIGAGTITCNYDGNSKHKTIIEDQAFIGSNTALVAPVIVGSKATVAAGTTLLKDAPAQQLTLNRKQQETVIRQEDKVR